MTVNTVVNIKAQSPLHRQTNTTDTRNVYRAVKDIMTSYAHDRHPGKLYQKLALKLVQISCNLVPNFSGAGFCYQVRTCGANILLPVFVPTANSYWSLLLHLFFVYIAVVNSS